MVVATAVHLGFQVTVTLIVYPALAATPASTWATAHAAHSRRIAPLVVVLYAALLASVAAALLERPDLGVIVSAVAVALTFGLTAAGAGPLHVRLRGARDDALLRRLLWVDRVRTLAALAALIAAAWG